MHFIIAFLLKIHKFLHNTENIEQHFFTCGDTQSADAESHGVTEWCYQWDYRVVLHSGDTQWCYTK